MEPHATIDAAMTFALALAAGMVVQALARHLRLPGIVLLLAAGHILGPDVLDWVRPQTLGGALQILVGFAVAVILFEGGLNLRLARLREQARVIRRLVTVGALITAVGGGLTVWLTMGWDWRLAAPFGALVVVTGPTVIGPLLRRIKVKQTVATVLEAEGVLIDAIGAILAVVTLEVVLSFSAESVAGGLLDLLARLGFGVVAGLVAGFLIAIALRQRRVVPEGLENVLTLSLVLVAFQASNALLPESGIVTAAVAGIVVGNVRTRVQRDLLEFKEQLTVMFIGLLFVLLAADVRVREVNALWIPGLLTVASLVLVVRPLNVAVSTAGSDLTGRERLFLAWMAPRGVVAAAVASLFARTLADEGIVGGERLQALIFTVIAATVLVQGLSGGVVARWLGLRRPSDVGWVILGANALARAVGRVLDTHGEEAVLIDKDSDMIRAAQDDDLKTVFGNALEERTLQKARLEERRGCLALTPNLEVNLLFAGAAAEYKVPRIFVGVPGSKTPLTPAALEDSHAEILFGRPRDLELWTVRLRRGLAGVERWLWAERPTAAGGEDAAPPDPFDFPETLLLPLVLVRGDKVSPVNKGQPPREGDAVYFAVFLEEHAEARGWMRERGWRLEQAHEPAE